MRKGIFLRKPGNKENEHEREEKKTTDGEKTMKRRKTGIARILGRMQVTSASTPGFLRIDREFVCANVRLTLQRNNNDLLWTTTK
jgi:hypothetical protein